MNALFEVCVVAEPRGAGEWCWAVAAAKEPTDPSPHSFLESCPPASLAAVESQKPHSPQRKDLPAAAVFDPAVETWLTKNKLTK